VRAIAEAVLERLQDQVALDIGDVRPTSARVTASRPSSRAPPRGAARRRVTRSIDGIVTPTASPGPGKNPPEVAHATMAAEAVTRALVGRTVADVERDLILETLKHCFGIARTRPTFSEFRSARCATSSTNMRTTACRCRHRSRVHPEIDILMRKSGKPGLRAAGRHAGGVTRYLGPDNRSAI